MSGRKSCSSLSSGQIVVVAKPDRIQSASLCRMQKGLSCVKRCCACDQQAHNGVQQHHLSFDARAVGTSVGAGTNAQAVSGL